MTAALLALATPTWAAGLTQAQVAAFAARQQAAWDARRLDAYFASFRPEATFTDQYRTPGGQLVPYGTSSLAQARAQTRRFLAGAKSVETATTTQVAVAKDGASARLVTRVVSRVQAGGGLRILCAWRVQIVRAGARLASDGQTDTFSRCPR